MRKTILVAVAATMMALAIPAMASANTSVPPLGSDTQAYFYDATPTAVAGAASVSGQLVLHGAATVTCPNATFDISLGSNGEGNVTTGSFGSCTTDIAGCNVAATPNLTYGVRLVYDGTDFRARINVALTNVYSGSCPYGSVPYTGVLSPVVTIDTTADTLTADFDGSAAGSLTSGLGSAFATGTVTGALTPSTIDSLGV